MAFSAGMEAAAGSSGSPEPNDEHPLGHGHGTNVRKTRLKRKWRFSTMKMTFLGFGIVIMGRLQDQVRVVLVAWANSIHK
jgi:hypothetical protein